MTDGEHRIRTFVMISLETKKRGPVQFSQLCYEIRGESDITEVMMYQFFFSFVFLH